MKIEIRPITKENEDVLALPNDPFLNEGRLIPLFDGRAWDHRIELFPPDAVTEDRFPDEHYVFEEMGEGFFGLAAYADGVPAGFALLYAQWDRWLYLDNLLVVGRYRRHGLGTALLEACTDLAVKLGRRGVRLVCQDNNLQALRFYLRNGFTLGGVNTRVYEGTKREGMADLYLFRGTDEERH